MLAVSIEKPFDDPEWLFEVKWDGYRAIASVDGGKARLVSRNQNDLMERFRELQDLPRLIDAESAILDGEVVALDAAGRASFSLIQQRTGFRPHGRRQAARTELPIVYYVFDLLYLNRYDLRRVKLEDRKRALKTILRPNELVRYSDHFIEHGMDLFQVAKQKGLEGILAKRRTSLYEERRTREWLKIKITQTVDCVVGGYTNPEGSRKYFGSLVLGLYDNAGKLMHVGQVGTGFSENQLKEIFSALKRCAASRTPFFGDVDASEAHWVKPELVAEVKFSEWTHETTAGGPKLRAPVFLGLRDDKKAKDCTFQSQQIQS